VTSAAHMLWAQSVHPGDCVVDATCGMGRDALVLAQLVGSNGTVHVFDIQKEAVLETGKLLQMRVPKQVGPSALYIACARVGCEKQQANHAWRVLQEQPNVKVHHTSHAYMATFVPEASATLVAFNLGYLPGADRSIMTSSESTLVALQASMQVGAAPLACRCSSTCMWVQLPRQALQSFNTRAGPRSCTGASGALHLESPRERD
jgi:hypothetical protein